MSSATSVGVGVGDLFVGVGVKYGVGVGGSVDVGGNVDVGGDVAQ
jgi:hypothetical protein